MRQPGAVGLLLPPAQAPRRTGPLAAPCLSVRGKAVLPARVEEGNLLKAN
jgi:hypothetical protein